MSRLFLGYAAISLPRSAHHLLLHHDNFFWLIYGSGGCYIHWSARVALRIGDQGFQFCFEMIGYAVFLRIKTVLSGFSLSFCFQAGRVVKALNMNEMGLAYSISVYSLPSCTLCLRSFLRIRIDVARQQRVAQTQGRFLICSQSHTSCTWYIEYMDLTGIIILTEWSSCCCLRWWTPLDGKQIRTNYLLQNIVWK